MQVHELVQGSPEWHAYRLTHFNASDAPAMMGCSPYKTRSQFVAELATGIGEDVTPEKQRIFDTGHQFEALARPLQEEIIGEDLYPVVGSKGKLSASFDGLTMDNRIAAEHKSLNDRLREAFRSMAGDLHAGHMLPLDYRVQMEQQCEVSDCEKVLFMASKWDANGNLIEMAYCWYYPDPALRAQIIAGWAQIEQDVCAYTPSASAPAALVAEPAPALPGVSVRVEGALVVTSNLDKFEVALRDFIEHRLITQPKTDQDFVDLDTQIKAMKGAEAALQSSDASMLAQIQPVDTTLKHSALLYELVRKHRIVAEKLLTSEKDRRRLEIVTDGQQAFRDHIASLNERLGKPYMPTIPADFAGAVKGMRSLANMEEAVSTLLTNLKVQANAVADKIEANLKHLREHAAKHAFLFADTSTIVLKAPEDLQMLVKSRISEHEAAEAKRLEEERERIRAEEVARLERAKAEEESLIASIWAQARRIEGDTVAYIKKAMTSFEISARDWEGDSRPLVRVALEGARLEMQAKLEAAQAREPATTAMQPAQSLVAANNAARAAVNQAAEVVPATSTLTPQRAWPIPGDVPESTKTVASSEIVWINTATLSERLGVPMSAALAEELGYPGIRRGGPGLWWDEVRVPAIGEALILRIRTHLSKLGQAVAA